MLFLFGEAVNMLNFLTQKLSYIYWSPAILSRDPIIIFKKGGSYEKTDIFVVAYCRFRI